MTILKCIAVDDEPLAMKQVCTYIDQTPFLKLVGQYNNPLEALKAIHDQEVDLVFLDIQMPGLTGIELARVLERGKMGPRIIFTTAYNQFAIEGFKVDALDYLLKPFNYEEFFRAANKALSYVDILRKSKSETVANATVASSPEADYLYLKVEYQLVRISFNDILYIQGYKDYVKVFLNNATRPILSLISLKVLEEKLPSNRFMRIHRSYIISLEQIKSVSRNSVQIGEEVITVSEQYKDAFSHYLSRWTN